MLTKQQTDYVIQLLQEGKKLPEEFKYDLFPTTHKEYELAYAGKMRKEDILANEDGVYPVPLQVEKVFNGEKYKAFDDDWKNMIVFGDNLQFLKTMNENKDPIIKDKVKGKVKLIYIDPPFATEEDFKSSTGQKAYTDKIKGADFIEFLRRRLLLAKEILAEDGFLFIHLDNKKSHYIKVVLDEIFGEKSFINEIMWKRKGGSANPSNKLGVVTDSIFLYSKNKSQINQLFSKDTPEAKKYIEERFNNIDENGRMYLKSPIVSPNYRENLVYSYKGYEAPPNGWSISITIMKRWDKEGKLYFPEKGKRIYRKIYLDEYQGQPVQNLWTDIFVINPMATERIDYPTQKPELLLKRILELTTQPNDIVIDFFAGSGVTASVAEKMNRRWISCDIGKLSFFTIQKRMLQIQHSKELTNSKKKYEKKAKSFMTCSLGLYDLKKTLDMKWDKYKEFAAGLFELELNSHKISGLEFDAKKNSSPVKMFDYKKFQDSSVDEDYLESIHRAINSKISGRVYIIAPANSIDFISDYHQIGNIKYYFLKIPYHMIKELHKTPFQKLRQPQSSKKINEVDEAIGFHFIRQPEVKTEISLDKNKVIVSIKEFRSQYSKDDEGRYLENFETLSAIFVDKDYNNEAFEMDEVYFADELLPKKKKKEDDIRDELKALGKDSLKLTLNKKDLGNKIMVVYTDIFGNDFTETFDIEGL